MLKPLQSFNSILVQLEVETGRIEHQRQIGFNSILVQLEVPASFRVQAQSESQFQFHIGAIRSEMVRSYKPIGISFNSILVQLEGTPHLSPRCGNMRFNSILVQLEAKKLHHSSILCRVSIPYWCN